MFANREVSFAENRRTAPFKRNKEIIVNDAVFNLLITYEMKRFREAVRVIR